MRRKHIQSKPEHHSRATEQYHFAKAKKSTLFAGGRAINTSLTPVQVAVLSLAIVSALQVTLAQASSRGQKSSTHQVKNPLSPLVCMANASMTAAPVCSASDAPMQVREYHGMPVTDATGMLMHCEDKKVGTSLGEICFYQGKKYMLKFTSEGFFTGKTYLESLYHQQLLKDYVGILVPNLRYFSAKQDGKDNIYLGSEFIDGFVSIAKLYKQVDYALFGEENWLSFWYHTLTSMDLIREKVSEAIRARVSEDEIAKLVVAASFVADLVDNENNWGIVNNRLVIVDLDSRGSTITDLISAANIPTHLPINLSVDTLTRMKEIYQTMLTRSAPHVSDEVDLSQTNYENLVRGYIRAIDITLENIATDKTIDPAKPSRRVNEIFSKGFLAASRQKYDL